mmetsp:Transcript_40690/g.115134  ORF Transcript_40690/g.115134 Transcript_40690/m.115134 type:complete len:250 (-) Transcript_40690:427-1176(-)
MPSFATTCTLAKSGLRDAVRKNITGWHGSAGHKMMSVPVSFNLFKATFKHIFSVLSRFRTSGSVVIPNLPKPEAVESILFSLPAGGVVTHFALSQEGTWRRSSAVSSSCSCSSSSSSSSRVVPKTKFSSSESGSGSMGLKTQFTKARRNFAGFGTLPPEGPRSARHSSRSRSWPGSSLTYSTRSSLPGSGPTGPTMTPHQRIFVSKLHSGVEGGSVPMCRKTHVAPPLGVLRKVLHVFSTLPISAPCTS